MSDSLQPHGLGHAMLPCPSLFTGVCLNSCLLSGWCYLIISSFTIYRSLLKFLSIEWVMLSNHLILCRPLSFCLQSFPEWGSFPMSLPIKWPKYWNFSFNISPSSEYSGLMLGRIEAWRRRGWQRIRWVDVKADSMDMSLCELPETVKDRDAWQAAVHEGANSCTWLND